MVGVAPHHEGPPVTDRNWRFQNGGICEVLPMPVIRFVREGCDVACYPGENLREVALREGIELYGLKGKLGNCGGCGQCITCFVDVEGASPAALSDRTPVEEQKLRRRPQTWRLACQSLVQESLLVLTRPQVGMADREAVFAEARSRPLPAGPTAWPSPPEEEEESAAAAAGAASGPVASATSGEEPAEPADGR
jgi:ferredoxin